MRARPARRGPRPGLLVVGLQQRLLSSIEAFARSLKVHRKTVERHWRKSQRAADTPAASAGDPVRFLKPPDADDERADWEGEDIEAEEQEQIEAITLAAESRSAGRCRCFALGSRAAASRPNGGNRRGDPAPALMPRRGCSSTGFANISAPPTASSSSTTRSTKRSGVRGRKPYLYRWPDAIRDEVLARLLELNAERAAEDARAGKPASTSQPTTAVRSPGRPVAGRSGGPPGGRTTRPLWGADE